MLTTLILALMPAAFAQADAQYAEVAVENTAIRSFYDSKSAAVLEVGKGFPVQVVAELVPWSKVRVPGGFDVWVHQDYVVFDAGIGTITSNRVRIRPLPSTAAESHALGHFSKGDQVIRLGKDGDWMKVRYKEQVAAWVLTKELAFPTRELSQWQRIWNDVSDARTVVPLPEVVVEVEPVTEGDGVVGTASTEGAVGTAGDGAAQPASAKGKAAESSAATSNAAATESAAEPAWSPIKSAQVALDPAKYQKLADHQLAVFSSAVTKSNDHWERAKIDNLEMVFGNVIWHSMERKEVDAARVSLTRLDGLRRFYLAALASEARRAEVAGDMILASTLKEQRLVEMKPRLAPGGGTFVVVGWVEYQPKVSARIPFSVVRGKRSIPLHSYDGHQNLRDFVNHEIVVRGTWREDKSVAVGHVLAITELRILPVRRK